MKVMELLNTSQINFTKTKDQRRTDYRLPITDYPAPCTLQLATSNRIPHPVKNNTFDNNKRCTTLF